jgi:hypothetical protein
MSIKCFEIKIKGQWQHIEFEQLKTGDVFRAIGHDGSIETDEEGNSEFVIVL